VFIAIGNHISADAHTAVSLLDLIANLEVTGADPTRIQFLMPHRLRPRLGVGLRLHVEWVL
jgi:hypothetical protein